MLRGEAKRSDIFVRCSDPKLPKKRKSFFWVCVQGIFKGTQPWWLSCWWCSSFFAYVQISLLFLLFSIICLQVIALYFFREVFLLFTCTQFLSRLKRKKKKRFSDEKHEKLQISIFKRNFCLWERKKSVERKKLDGKEEGERTQNDWHKKLWSRKRKLQNKEIFVCLWGRSKRERKREKRKGWRETKMILSRWVCLYAKAKWFLLTSYC